MNFMFWMYQAMLVLTSVHSGSIEIRQHILKSTPIEPKLNVIFVIFSPFSLIGESIHTYLKNFETVETDTQVYIVEMAYQNQTYSITNPENPHHLQLRSKDIMWQKENLVNVAVRNLLPPTWKAFAWIDLNVEFESNTWAMDTLKILNGHKDVVQLWTACFDWDNEKKVANQVSISAGYIDDNDRYNRNRTGHKSFGYRHVGYAWAMTRPTYEKLGGIYDRVIIGSGDSVLYFTLVSRLYNIMPKTVSKQFKQDVNAYYQNAKQYGFKFGYVPGTILHQSHGNLVHRKYVERWQYLVRSGYDPSEHVTYTPIGLMVATYSFPEKLHHDLYMYFKNLVQ